MDLEEPGPTSLPGLKVLRLKGNRESGHVVMGSMSTFQIFLLRLTLIGNVLVCPEITKRNVKFSPLFFNYENQIAI